MRISAVWYPVSQWEAAKTFYGEVLGLTLAQVNDTAGWAAYATDGPPLFLVRRRDLAGGTGGAVVTFECPDLEALHDRVIAAGGRVEEVLQNSGNLLIMTFYDPDGNRLEAAQVIEQG
ncbi:MAG: VOC family protein [Anaerolineales bacterium]|nr:VOC family protein [Anaerolineales bacterium]